MVALKARHLAMLVPGIFVVLVGLAMAFGRWNTERSRRFADLVGGSVSDVGSGSGAGAGRAAPQRRRQLALARRQRPRRELRRGVVNCHAG